MGNNPCPYCNAVKWWWKDETGCSNCKAEKHPESVTFCEPTIRGNVVKINVDGDGIIFPSTIVKVPDKMPEDLMESAVYALLMGIDANPEREGLKDTPRRVVKMLKELCKREAFFFTTFDAEGMSEMIVQTDIPMHSLCEHHMLPFMGTATVAYIPGKKLVGLSKLARAVKYHSAGLQNQERITMNVAHMLLDSLQPVGVGVVIRARHLCMEMRGVCAPNVYTTTSMLYGCFRTDPTVRSEFLALARG